MEKKKQSSIDWLVEAIMKYDKSFKEFYGAEIEQAKAMHEEEIMEAHYAPQYGCFSKDYYNETFGE